MRENQKLYDVHLSLSVEPSYVFNNILFWFCFCLQEDMDSMQKELDIWRRENKEHEIALRREER